MMLIAFRARLTAAAGDDYGRMVAEMEAYAKTFPGFIDARDYVAPDGERLTLVWWADAESLRVWAEDPRHRAVQATGRERWYEYYKMDVAEIARVSQFDRRTVRV
jgi:heme-degrading monooxygenase HmoA